LLLGCSSGGNHEDTTTTSYDEGRRAFCQGFCAGLVRCNLDGYDCVPYCLDHYQPTGVRGEALASVGTCEKSADCATLGSDEPASACFAEVAAAEPLREQLISYCESAARNYFECNIWWSVDDCLGTMGTWEDELLRQAQICHLDKCSELEGCEDSVFNPKEAAR
jgi:hypothetical protein